MSYLNIRQKLNKIPKGAGGMTLNQVMEEMQQYQLLTGKTVNVNSASDPVTGWLQYKQEHPEIDSTLSTQLSSNMGFQPTMDLNQPLTFNRKSATDVYANQLAHAADVTVGNPNSMFGAATVNTQTGDITNTATGNTQTDNSLGEGESIGDDKSLVGLANAGKQIISGVGGLFGQGGQAGAAGMNAGINALMNGDEKAAKAGLIGGALTMGMNAVDNLAMSDKNFSGASQAIDSGTHMISSALMQSGNPYAMAAGAALEGVNFLSKAGGQTVEGYKVDVNNSGYSDSMMHEESKSFRNLFGINNKRIENALEKRNEHARMAMTAAEISKDIDFEQTARLNSIENTLMANQEALAGGYNTSTLGA